MFPGKGGGLDPILGVGASKIEGRVSFPPIAGSDVKESACNAGGQGSIPGSGRSPGEENGYPLQYSCLENPMDRESGGLQSMGSQRVRHH